jgi:hypothetical protein
VADPVKRTIQADRRSTPDAPPRFARKEVPEWLVHSAAGVTGISLLLDTGNATPS